MTNQENMFVCFKVALAGKGFAVRIPTKTPPLSHKNPAKNKPFLIKKKCFLIQHSLLYVGMKNKSKKTGTWFAETKQVP
jgi:hypothetical protein